MGHSTSSGRGNPSGRTTAAERESVVESGTSAIDAVRSRPALRRELERAIDSASISSEGNGNWGMDIPGVGGGQILDETGGTRDPMYGRGGKVYSIRAWDSDYNMIHQTTIGGSLNDAKRELRDALHRHYR